MVTNYAIPLPRRVSTQELFLKLWIYGDPGTGKTTFASQALDHPKLGPALFIDIEGGLLSVAGRGDIDAVEITSPDDIDRITYAILTRHEAFAHYKTIIVDSLTVLQDMSLKTIVNAAMAKAPARDRSIDDIEIGDYGKSSTQMKRLVGALRNAPIHVIFTGLAKRDYPKGADPKLVQPTAVGPSLTSKLADAIMGVMDAVWYLYPNPETGTRTILTANFNQFKAKTRGPRFAESLGLVHENPHLPTLYDLLLETEGSSNANVAPPGMFFLNPTLGPAPVMPTNGLMTEGEALQQQQEQAALDSQSPEATGDLSFASSEANDNGEEPIIYTDPGIELVNSSAGAVGGSPFSVAGLTSTPIPLTTPS